MTNKPEAHHTQERIETVRNTLLKGICEFRRRLIVGLRDFLNAKYETDRERSAQDLFSVVLTLVQAEEDITKCLGGVIREATEFVLNEFSEYEIYYGSELCLPAFKSLRRDKMRLIREAKRLLQALRASA